MGNTSWGFLPVVLMSKSGAMNVIAFEGKAELSVLFITVKMPVITMIIFRSCFESEKAS